MGRHKQLLNWQGTTLLKHTIETANKLSDTVMVVLGHKAERMVSEITSSIHHCVNSAWKKGMGTSIALGIKELKHIANPNAILILLVDQPLIDTVYLKRMIKRYTDSKNKIIATSYKGEAGVPAVFPASFFEELKALNEDYGAKNVLKQNRERVVLLEADDKIIDIDTPEVYNYLNKIKTGFTE